MAIKHYVDQIPSAGGKVYTINDLGNGTSKIIDSTTYEQQGSTFGAMDINDIGILECTHTKEGTVHKLTTPNTSSTNIKFIASDNYSVSDTFTLNDTVVDAKLINGLNLESFTFTTGAVVNCSINNGTLYFNGGMEPNHKTLLESLSKSRYVDVNGIESPSGEYTQINNNGVWEWLNPPLNYDMEYRTTLRYKGKVVYQQIVSLGALPNATSKTVTLPFSPVTHKAWFQGDSTVNSTFDMLPSSRPGYTIDLYRSGKNVTIITTNSTLSQYSAYMLIEYVK